jgi:hypothetical protein
MLPTRRFQQAIVEICEKRAPQESTPLTACPGCFDEFGTPANMVEFDCGHTACLACVTNSLLVLRDSSSHIGQPLPCFLGRDSCNGVLFCVQTRSVLRRIQTTELPPPKDAAPRMPDAAAADADTPRPATGPGPNALDSAAVG